MITEIHQILNQDPLAPAVVSEDNSAKAMSLPGRQGTISQAQVNIIMAQSAKATRDIVDILSRPGLATGRPAGLAAPAGAVVLRAPQSPQDQPVDNHAMMIKLLGNWLAMEGNNSLNNLKDWWQNRQQRNEVFRQLSQAQAKEYQAALEKGDAAIKAAENDAGTLESAQQYLKEKQAEYRRAKDQLDKLKPDDAGYQQAKTKLEQAGISLHTAKQEVMDASNAATRSLQQASEAMQKVDELYLRNQALVEINGDLLPKKDLDNINSSAYMLLLMSRVLALLEKNSESDLINDRDVFQQVQAKRQQEMQNKANEYDEQMRKADQLNKTMGCAGKILGGVIIAVSVAGAAFTGGASLAIAAVGLALMAGDAVGKAITGVSFIDQAMQPVMEQVIQPLIAEITKAVTKLLQSMGVAENQALLIGSIIGAVVAAALIVAVILVGKSAGTKLASSALGKLAGDMARKMIPEMLKKMSRETSKTVTSGMSRLMSKLSAASDRAAMDSYANSLKMMSLGLTVVDSGSQITGQVVGGVLAREAQQMLAGFSLAQSDSAMVKKALESALDRFADLSNQTAQMRSVLSDLVSQRTNTTTHILSNVHA